MVVRYQVFSSSFWWRAGWLLPGLSFLNSRFKKRKIAQWKETTTLSLPIGGRERDGDLVLSALRRSRRVGQTRNLIDPYWNDIGRVARALLEYDHLSGTAVKKIIEAPRQMEREDRADRQRGDGQ
jgi:hypothetical protein